MNRLGRKSLDALSPVPSETDDWAQMRVSTPFRNLTPTVSPDYVSAPAEVVELVDALASGASGRKLVGVRVPPSAFM